MANEAAAAPLEGGSRWEDLVDVYFSPAELYARRAGDNWLKPFLLLIVIGIVFYYLFLPLNSLIWEAAMLESAPPGADVERMRQGAAVMKYVGGIFVPINYFLLIAFTALVLKVASSVLEPAARWGEAFTIATYAFFVTVLQQILGTLIVFLKSRSAGLSMQDVSFGALRFVEQPDPVLRALLGRLDLFAVWTAALCAVGLIVVVRMPRAKAIITAAIAWLALALPSLASSAMFGRR